MIIITSFKEGFRRCGVAHSATPTEYSDNRFSKEELEILKKEKMLKVEFVADEMTEDERKQKIIQAIEKLDTENQELWTQDGRPTTVAIEEICGFDISAKERDSICEGLEK